jgi:hypothetical protein
VGPEAQLRIVDRNGEIFPASLADAHVPVWWLAILRLAVEGRRPETVLLLPDSSGAEALRRLRGWILGPGLRRSDGARGTNARLSTKDPGQA